MFNQLIALGRGAAVETPMDVFRGHIWPLLMYAGLDFGVVADVCRHSAPSAISWHVVWKSVRNDHALRISPLVVATYSRDMRSAE